MSSGNYWFDKGVEYQAKEEYELALHYFRSAIENGNFIRAYGRLGTLYRDGKGTKKCMETAMNLFHEGEVRGCTYCAACLAIRYYYGGHNIEKNYDLAVKYGERCENDYASGSFIQGQVYAKSDKSYHHRYAIRHLIKAKKMGHENENLDLDIGNLYYKLSEYDKAIEYYSLDVEHSTGFSSYNLGLIYLNGLIGEPDYERALGWFIFFQENNPDDEDIKLRLAETYEKLGVKNYDDSPILSTSKKNQDPQEDNSTQNTVSQSSKSSISTSDALNSDVVHNVDDLIEELNSMIGLESVKNRVSSMVAEISIRKERQARGLSSNAKSNHMIFTGNAGTGKTVVARLISKIMFSLEVTKKDVFIEATRADLVAQYVGQTAIKTNEIVDSALGGILFIDEAYTLAQGGESDFGKEAIATLLKRIEDERDNLIVIMAGYEKEMGELMDSNQGLESRFGRTIDFEDYTDSELTEIFYKFCKDNNFIVEDGLKETVTSTIRKIRDSKRIFANARDVRNTFERVAEHQEMRIYQMGNLSSMDNKTLQTITSEDILFS